MQGGLGMNRHDTMRDTGNSWADRKAMADQNNAMLPDIGAHRKGQPPMGASFQSMGRMTGAAGFKRDSVASRGGGGNPYPGLTGFTYNDPNAAQ